MSGENSEQQLEEVGAAYANILELESARVEARRRLRLAVLQAHRAGAGGTEIAKRIGKSRAYVYQLLDAAETEFPSA